MSEEKDIPTPKPAMKKFGWGWIKKTTQLEQDGFCPAPDGYQPEPDIHDIEMVGSELWIKDKEDK